MQFKASVAALALAAASRVAAQAGLDQLPTCALNPALAAIQSTGCGTDIKCVCEDSAFISALAPAIQKACSPEDFAKTGQAAEALCKSVGVTITLPIPISSGPGPVETSSVEATSTPEAETTTVPVVITTTTLVATGTGTGAAVPPTNGTVTQATPTVASPSAPVSTAGAPTNLAVQGGAVALGAAAALFFAL